MKQPVVLLVAGILVLASGVVSTQTRSNIEIRTLSTRAETVSGGDALVQVGLAGSTTPENVTIAVNGRDVKAAFRPAQDPKTLVGLVSGLQVGRNTLEVGVNGKTQARLV